MSSNVQFDEAASRLSTSKTSDGSVLGQILRSSAQAGIDPVAELYNEALSLAKDGHYGDARSRLQVLLGLAPNDGDAHLLLAKVYVAGQQWRRALAALDEAGQCNASVPDSLRDAVVRHLQADVDEEEDRSARQVREQGEMKKLRSEARRLRSENAHLRAATRSHEKEAARFAWLATVTSVVAILLLIWDIFFGVPAAEEPMVTQDVSAETQPAVPELDEPTPVPAGGGSVAAVEEVAMVRDPGLAGSVQGALDAEGVGDNLAVVVRDTTASLSGTVPDHASLKAAVAAAEDVPGIDTVNADAVVNTSRCDGGLYTVRSGDSLSVIAYRQYGAESLYKQILDANPDLGGKPNLQIGQELVIPAVD